MSAGAPRWREVLDFWFLPADHPDYGAFRRQWFDKNPAFDEEIRRRFSGDTEAAAAGERDEWARHARGALALVVLLDQFPRNLYRGTPRAFAADGKARRTADRAQRAGFDCAIAPVQRLFLYLPFEHSENIADQDRGVTLYEALPPAPWRAEAIHAVRRHREIIERFGRFPHRNMALGRASTPQELDFLRQPHSSF